MRMAVILLAGMLLGGCASEQQVATPVQPIHRQYLAASASALAFDPPVLAGAARVDLSRDARGPAAFDGFTESTTTVYSLSVDDWFNDNNRSANQPSRDAYQRHAVSETLEVSHQ
jgi:hypothetical protein